MYAAPTYRSSGSHVTTCARQRRLAANGVAFNREPAEQDYSGIGAAIDDGCGNVLNLHQATPHDPRGRQTRKMVPVPGALSRAMVPPCSSTTRLAMESPRPLPPA